MNGDSFVVVDRLTRYVDELLDARRQNNAAAIRGRTQMILMVLHKLQTTHRVSPLPSDLIQKIESNKLRAHIDMPDAPKEYTNTCWDCYAHGEHVTVDKRVDSTCEKCGWVQCPECGACRDPKHGGCIERIYRKKFLSR